MLQVYLIIEITIILFNIIDIFLMITEQLQYFKNFHFLVD